MLGTQVQSPVWDDSTRHEQLSLCDTATEAHLPKAHALRQENTCVQQ